MSLLVHQYLERAAGRSPHALAIIAPDASLTYAELNARATRLSARLVAAGVRRGDRVVIQLENGIAPVIGIHAVLKAGAAFTMVHPSAKPERLAHIARDAGASAVVLSTARLTAAAALLAGIPSVRTAVTTTQPPASVPGLDMFAIDDVTRGDALPDVAADPIDLDLAALLYTSGSTGGPKGVMLTHLNVATAIDAITQYLGLTSADVLMNVLPLSFGYGLTQLFSAFNAGATLVIEAGMAFPHVTLSRMAEHRVTGFAMVPTIGAMLVGLDLRQYELSSLRYITNAGAALPRVHFDALRAALPRTSIIPMYGQTECLRISYLDPAETEGRGDSVGRGMPNQDIWLEDAAGRRCAPGTVGELVVRGNHVMRGYWQRPEETSGALRPGLLPGETVLHTGDLFRQDENGYLYFVARQDDIIKCKGEKVSPGEIEDVLYSLEGVAEAVVAGVPHPLLGQAVKAVIVLRPGASLNANDVKRHCASRLEEYMVPTDVEFRPSLAKTETGKIVRQQLS